MMYCSYSRSFWQCVISFSAFCPSKIVPATSVESNSTRSGTNEQLDARRRKWPRVFSLMCSVRGPWSVATVKSPGYGTLPSTRRSLLIFLKSAETVNGNGSFDAKSGRRSASCRRVVISSSLGHGAASFASSLGSTGGFLSVWAPADVASRQTADTTKYRCTAEPVMVARLYTLHISSTIIDHTGRRGGGLWSRTVGGRSGWWLAAW